MPPTVCLQVCNRLAVGTGRYYFDRDVDCIVTFFEKRFRYVSDKPRPTWEGVLATRQGTLDVIAAASGFIGDKEIAEFEKAGGLGERFGDEEGELEVAAQEEEEEDDEEDDDESEPAVVNQGSGQGGEKIIERDEDIQFKSLRQAEALALRRLGEDTIGNMYSSQLEPEPEPGPGDASVDAESDTGGVPRLGEESKVLEIKRAERDKSGHRKVAAEARLARLAELSGEQTTDDVVGEDSEDEEDEEDEDTAGLERVDVSHNVAAGKVHFIQPKEVQKQGGEPEEDDANPARGGSRPRYARGGGRRAPPKKLTAEEQAALIRQRVAKSKSGRPRNGGGRRGQEGGHGKKSKAKNAGNKNVKAMMQSI
eukprot:COSAG02_NODE_1322_length_13259_cov_71.269985_3_plen_366_part_00